MNRVIFQTVLPIMVFSTLIIREATSYLLYMFPGEEILWYISFNFGHNLLPFQYFMDNIVSGFFTKISIFLLLISAAILGYARGKLLFRFLACHAAFAMVSVYGIITFVSGFSRSASLGPSLVSYVYVFELNHVMILPLLISLFYGCAQTHIAYFQKVKLTSKSQ